MGLWLPKYASSSPEILGPNLCRDYFVLKALDVMDRPRSTILIETSGLGCLSGLFEIPVSLAKTVQMSLINTGSAFLKLPCSCAPNSAGHLLAFYRSEFGKFLEKTWSKIYEKCSRGITPSCYLSLSPYCQKTKTTKTPLKLRMRNPFFWPSELKLSAKK